MFKKILFATTASPASDNAAHVAFDLAKKYEAELKVFHVFGLPSRGFSTTVKDMRTGEEMANDQDYTNWVLEEMKNTYEKQSENVKSLDFQTLAGVPHTEILREARKYDADLIVMGAHTREEDVGASRYRNVIGSTMQRVARGAKCPVLIVSRPCTTCFWYFSNVVFGTDFSKASDSAFKFAFRVSNFIGCKLYLFHCLDMSSIASGKTFSQEEVEEQIQKAKEKIEKRYVSQMGDFDNYEVEVLEGIPYIEIVKYSRRVNGDLIIMAHHAKEIDPEKALLGSTVEQVVLRASCPVASVNRPDKVEEE
ncbi:MAG: universal stress protein [Desulfococcaceae bacterium]|jgi:nucleotide-binding universal stress UspA family protein|nr:universal stress protein [Desulfococcaceae bacterium]